MHVDVPLAFIATELAGDDAGVQLRMHELIGRFGLPREHAQGGLADIGTIQVCGDAVTQPLDVFRLADAGVGARGAGGAACVYGVQRVDVVSGMLAVCARMAAQHHIDGFHERRSRPRQWIVHERDRRIIRLPGLRHGGGATAKDRKTRAAEGWAFTPRPVARPRPHAPARLAAVCARVIAGQRHCALRVRHWAAVLALTLLSGCVAPRAPEPAVWTRTTMGLCEDYPEESRTIEHARRDLAVAAASGAQVLRIAFGWDAMEPERGQYDWSFWDEFVRSAADAHVQLIPYVCYTPKWAATDQGEDYWRSPPRDPRDFARFMGGIVRRYKGTIRSWELWNEPDNRSYWLGSPEQYAALTLAGSAAVREADPSARIVLGGIAGEVDFLSKILVDGRVAPAVDVVNFHSYFETWHPNSIEQLPAYVDSVAKIVRGTGRRLPLWMAEVGYSTVGDRTDVSDVYRAHFRGEHSEDAQAAAVARTVFTTLATRQVSLFAWYRINDLPAAQEVIGDDNNRHLGLVRADGSPKPALESFTYAARLFSEPYDVVPATVTTLSGTAPGEVRVFRRPADRYLIAAWLGIPSGPAPPAAAVDMRTATLRVVVPHAIGRTAVFRDARGRDLGSAGVSWRNTRQGIELTLSLRSDAVIVAEIER